MNKLEQYKIETPKLNKDMLEFVSAIITNKQGNVLILKRRENLKLDPSKYDLCSGHMKEGENPIYSMLRELEEELNLSLEKINSIESIGIIPTPHNKFPNTKCHMYHVMINLTEEQINEMIKHASEPEIEEAIYLKDLDVLRDLKKNSNLFRTTYNEDVERMFKKIEKIIQRKNKKEEKCEER